MLKKAIAYRAGSMLIGICINYALFGSIELALLATVIFTVALTAYYVLFHRLWPESLPESEEFSLRDTPLTDEEVLRWGDSLPRGPNPPDMIDIDV